MKVTKELQTAGMKALIKLYADWERVGGPSPDTADESRVVAEAIGSTVTPTPAQLEEIWDESCDGASPWLVAGMHIEVL